MILRMILTLVIFSIFGCSSNGRFVVQDYYTGLKFYDKTMAVVPVFESPSVANGEDVTDDFGEGVPEEVYMAVFKEHFPGYLEETSTVGSAFFYDGEISVPLNEQLLEVSSMEQLRAQLPEEGKTLTFDSTSADFVLFIFELNTARTGTSSGKYSLQTGEYEGGRFGNLQQAARFAVWDNVKGRLIMYGRAHKYVTVPLNLSEAIWWEGMRGLADDMFSMGPFFKL